MEKEMKTITDLEKGLMEAKRSDRPVVAIKPEIAGKIFTPKKNEIHELLKSEGSLSVSEIAERTGRKISAISRDINTLEFVGLVEKNRTGKEVKVKHRNPKILVE